VVVPGTSVAATVAVPDNCHTVRVHNPSGTNAILVGIGVPGVALVAGTNAEICVAGGDIYLPIGTYSGAETSRGPMDQAQVAGSGLVYDCGAVIAGISITYYNANNS
jgi:hypothetical protein